MSPPDDMLSVSTLNSDTALRIHNIPLSADQVATQRDYAAQVADQIGEHLEAKEALNLYENIHGNGGKLLSESEMTCYSGSKGLEFIQGLMTAGAATSSDDKVNSSQNPRNKNLLNVETNFIPDSTKARIQGNSKDIKKKNRELALRGGNTNKGSKTVSGKSKGVTRVGAKARAGGKRAGNKTANKDKGRDLSLANHPYNPANRGQGNAGPDSKVASQGYGLFQADRPKLK